MMENRRDFHHDDLLGRAVEAVLRNPIPDELSPEQVAQLVAVVQQAASKPRPVTLMKRIRNMKLRTKLAVAATALIAFVGLISWLVPGSGVAVAFADVAEALNSVHSATWKATTVVEMKVPQNKTTTFSKRAMFLSPSHERTEATADGAMSIHIVDGQKGKMISLVPTTKTAMVINLKNFPPQNSPFGRTFQGLRELVSNAQSGKVGKVERLGVKTIDGRSAQGFDIQLGATEVKIWADPKTLLPIRVEQTNETAGVSKVSIVMTDFKVNIPLDESLFSVDVPPGYTVQQTMQLDASKSPWAYLADGLKMAAEHNDGEFPPTLRGAQGIDGIMLRATKTLAEKHSKASPQERMKQATELSMKLAAALGVVNALPQDAYHYAGKDVKLGTPDRPIFWIKQKKDGRCVVIYADLSIKETSANEAPKVPQSEGAPKS